MAKILVADDEQLIRKLISDCLEKEGHTVFQGEDGDSAFALFQNESPFDLIILDIMMPGLDGWQLCRKIRETDGVPIMLVSARSQDFDQIMGFESGADDYVTKPFSLAVLMRRINTLLKRGSSPVEDRRNGDEYVYGDLCLSASSHEVYLKGEKVELTVREFGILRMFCENPGIVFTREQILDELWGRDYAGEERTVDSHVARLRTKLGEWGTKRLVTVYGTGYKLTR